MLFLSKIGKFAFYFPKISCFYHVYFKLHTGLTKNWVKIGKNVKFSSKNGGFLIQIQRFCTYTFLFAVQRLYSYHIYFFELWNYIYIYSYLKSLCTVYVLYRTSLWCKHRVVCDSCYNQGNFQKCPLCRTDVIFVIWIKIFVW